MLYCGIWTGLFISSLTLSQFIDTMICSKMTSSTLLHQHCLLTAGLCPLVHSQPQGKDGSQVGKSLPSLVSSCGNKYDTKKTIELLLLPTTFIGLDSNPACSPWTIFGVPLPTFSL